MIDTGTSCGAANLIPRDNLGKLAKCGRCKQPLGRPASPSTFAEALSL